MIYVVAGRDADRRDRLSYTLEAGPERMAVSGTTGELTWQPYNEDVGYHPVRVSVSDGKASAVQDFTLVVSASPTNFPLHITASPPASGRVGYEYSCTFSAADPDGDAVRFSLGRASPAGASVGASTGHLSWMPSAAQAGLNALELLASDGTDAVHVAFAVNVSSEGANALPVVALGAPPPARAGQPYTYNLTATDPDGDQPAFSLLSGPANATLSTTGSFAWTPALADTGNHSVAVKVSDGKGFTLFNFTVRVGGINREPVFAGMPAILKVPAGRAWNFIAQAADADGDALSYYLVQKPSGMTINPSTGALSWTPKPSLSGKYRVSGAVSDGFNTTHLNFTLTVQGKAAAPGLFEQYGLVFTLIIVAVLAGGGAMVVLSMRRPRPAGGAAPAEEPAEAPGAGEAGSPPAALGKPRIVPPVDEPAPAAPAPPAPVAPALPPPEPASAVQAEPLRPVGTISKELKLAVDATMPPPAPAEAPAAPPLPPAATGPVPAPSVSILAPAGPAPAAEEPPRPFVAPPPAPTLFRPPPAPTVKQPEPPAQPASTPEPAPKAAKKPPELYKPIPGPYDEKPLSPGEKAARFPAPAEEPPAPPRKPALDAFPAAPKAKPAGITDDMDFIATFLQRRDKPGDEKVLDKSSEWDMLRNFNKELESSHEKPREPAPAGTASPPPGAPAPAPPAGKPAEEKPPSGKALESLTLDDILEELEH
jgi:hypothetical protein